MPSTKALAGGALSGAALVLWASLVHVVNGLEGFDAVLLVRAGLSAAIVAGVHAAGRLGFSRAGGYAVAAGVLVAGSVLPIAGFVAVGVVVGVVLGDEAVGWLPPEASTRVRLAVGLGVPGALLVSTIVLGAVADRVVPHASGLVGQSVVLAIAALAGMRLTMKAGLRAAARGD